MFSDIVNWDKHSPGDFLFINGSTEKVSVVNRKIGLLCQSLSQTTVYIIASVPCLFCLKLILSSLLLFLFFFFILLIMCLDVIFVYALEASTCSYSHANVCTIYQSRGFYSAINSTRVEHGV